MKTHFALWIFMILALLLAGCQGDTPTEGLPTATQEPATQPTAEATQAEATAIPTLAATPEPTVEPTAEPTTAPVEMLPIETVPRSAVMNIAWQWAALLEAGPTAQAVIPDPERYSLVLKEDLTFAVQADCNQGSGTYTAEGATITLTLGPLTKAACEAGSFSEMFLDLLGRVSGFGQRGDRLVLLLAEDAGELDFANGGWWYEQVVEATPDTTCEPGIAPASVNLDLQTLPYTAYQSNCISATAYDNAQAGNPNGLPDHIQVNFGATKAEDRQPGDPVIYIIPIAAYKQWWQQHDDAAVTETHDRLLALLRARPVPLPSADMPVLPFEQVPAVNDLVTQYEYVDTANGFGVRFIGRFSQGPMVVTNDNPQLFYIFQGMSDDGLYLIAFFYPISTAELPNSAAVTEAEQQQLAADPQGYIKAKAQELDEVYAAKWTPNLFTLDAAIASLQFPLLGFASPLTGITWAWTDLVKPDEQATIPNPAQYTLLMREDNTFSFVADCNSGSGRYTLDGDNITLALETITTAACAEGSLSERYTQLLGQVSAFELAEGYLVFKLADDAGRLGFTVGSPIAENPDLAPEDPAAEMLDVINVRSGPGVAYPSYGLAPKGAQAKLLGKSADGTWWVIELPLSIAADGRGWVSAEFVEVKNAEAVPVIEAPPLP